MFQKSCWNLHFNNYIKNTESINTVLLQTSYVVRIPSYNVLAVFNFMLFAATEITKYDKKTIMEPLIFKKNVCDVNTVMSIIFTHVLIRVKVVFPKRIYPRHYKHNYLFTMFISTCFSGLWKNVFNIVKLLFLWPEYPSLKYHIKFFLWYFITFISFI